MAKPGDLSSKKIKNSYKAIVQHDGATSRLYDGTGSRVNSIDVPRITASNASLANIQDLQHLTVSRVQIDTHLSVSGSTFLGDDCGTDQVKVVGNTWITGSLTVSGSCQGSFRSIGQAKFIYLDNPGIEDQKPARVTRGMVKGKYNVPRFGGEVAALDVYGNAVITGSLIVTDTVFAQEFHSETVSQSIIFTSGSTKFGGDFNDTMTVTGSIFQSGSDVYFLNGIGIGTTGSLKTGTFDEPGQDNPVEFTHLLTISDPGHNGLQYKKGKLIYAGYGSKNATHVSASDTVRVRDYSAGTVGDDVFVISQVSKSVFFSTNDEYNVGISVPSGSNSQVDQKLVVSSSSDTRVKIESATKATSASLYLESGQGVWELAVASRSAAEENMLEESLVFRTRNSKAIHSAWSANGTYAESLRLNNLGKAGFNIPYDTATYELNQQVTVSGSLNIIQGRTIDINSGTFHNSDNTNGIYFNNQKMIYVSGSGAATSIFLGVAAGGVATATDGHANIGFGYQSGMSLTSGHRNVLIGDNAGKAVSTGDANVFIGEAAGLKATTAENCIAIGTGALYNTVAGAQSNIAIGHMAIKTGVATGDYNTAIGTLALEDLTTGADNVAIGSSAALNLTTATDSIAIGHDAMSGGVTTGNTNIGIGKTTLNSLIAGTGNIALGRSAGKAMVDNEHNIAIGHHALYTSAGTADKNIAIGYNAMKGSLVTGADNIGIGQLALDALLGGANNIALGKQAAEELTTGSDNIALGLTAMGAGITTGDRNIAIGKLSLNTVTGGEDNIAIGYRALRDTQATAARNVAIGYQVAYDGVLTGVDNIIMGTDAANAATSLTENIVIGHKAVETGVMTGDHNTVIGPRAAQIITSGADNVIIGGSAGVSVNTNTKNVLIGSGSDASAGLDNAYAIGTGASVAQADSLILGGQTGKRFRTAIGGITKPNATLEVSGTINVTGSAVFSGSATNGLGHEGHTLKTIGTTVMSGTLNNEHFRKMRALEVSGTTSFHGNMFITGNLFVSDIVVAQEFHTEFVSASITFSSGSNKMGDTNDDMQMMTGSLRVSGSGAHYFMGKQDSSGVGPGAGGSGNAKVGINTMAPAYELEVAGDVGIDRFIYHSGDTDTHLLFSNTDKLRLSAGGHRLSVSGSTNNSKVVINESKGEMNFQIQGLTHAGSLDEENVLFVSGGALITENSATQRGSVGIRTSNPTKALTVSGSISASNDLYVLGDGTFGTATVNIKANGQLTASSNIWASGIGSYISSSTLRVQHLTASRVTASVVSASLMVVAKSGSFLNLVVTGSGAAGSGSFGRIDVDRIRIHNHEIVDGAGLTVDGLTTILGTAGQNDQPTVMHGNLTASNAWFSGSGGNISASTMTLTNNLTIMGNISATHITASGEISSSSTGSFAYLRVAANPVPAASNNVVIAEFVGDSDSLIIKNEAEGDYSIGNNAQDNKIVFRDGSGGLDFYYNNLNLMALTEHGVGISATNSTVNNAAGQTLQVRGNISGSGALTVQGSGSFGGHVTASGNIKSAGDISASGTGYFGNVYAPGNISSSITATGSFGDGRFISRVGIGTNTPDCSLEVDAAADNLIARFNSTTNEDITKGIRINAPDAGGTQIYMDLVVDPVGDKVGIGIGTAGGNLPIGDANLDNAELVIDSSGNIGIGTSSPTEILTVEGTISGSSDLHLGHGSDGTGNIRISGSVASRNYRSFYIAAAGMTPSVTNGASTGTEERPGNAGGDITYSTVDYLAFDASTNEAANFQIAMPGEWDLGTIKARFYFMTDTADGGTNNDIRWAVYAEAISDNESINNDFNSAVAITSTAHNDDEKLVISDATVALTVENSPAALDLITFQVTRFAGAAADTYAGDAHLLGVSIQYQERVIPEAAW